MAEEKKSEETKSQAEKKDYVPPKAAKKEMSILLKGKNYDYEAEVNCIVLRKDDKPMAEMFYTSYIVKNDDKNRPITFVFNGGPGSSSVYIHFGAVGPKRIDLGKGGAPLPPPHKLIDNEDSWLRFTDLVFIDPIGTGFSRLIPDENTDKNTKDGEAKNNVPYWTIKGDLNSFGEFVSKYLSKNSRWESPIYVAGESYGGFRTARFAHLFQEKYAIPLSGIIIISPALEFVLLDGSDYDDLPWLDTFPSMAGAAFYHGVARKTKKEDDLKSYMKRASEFAVKDLLPVLASGDFLGEQHKKTVLDTAADFIGIPRSIMEKKNGKITIDWFVKNLLRDKGLILGLYDCSATVKDPYPDRDEWYGPDATLHVIERVFGAAINSQLRHNIGFETDRDYVLSSDDANSNWKDDVRNHVLNSQIGSTDELRYGMSINPHMKVYLTHGIFDLVTPHFAAERISRLMKLDNDRSKMLTVKHYNGGHMFYCWGDSRSAFSSDMEEFYNK